MACTLENRRLRFETPEWSGVVALDSTGNMLRLFHKKTQMEILSQPESEEALKESPMVYGIPLLFPPNRIRYALRIAWNCDRTRV